MRPTAIGAAEIDRLELHLRECQWSDFGKPPFAFPLDSDVTLKQFYVRPPPAQ
jgi:hypothetical protein